VESLWRKQTPNIEPLKGKENTLSTDTHRDVIVVGAGLAGVLIAYYLKESGKKVLVLESGKIASGQTEGTTAKITSQHDIKYTKLINEMGVETARLYAQANESAIREYDRLIKEKHIECDFKKCPAYLYTTGEEVLLMEEAMVAASLGIDAAFTTETELPFPITGAVCFHKQARFSPLKFVKAIAKELEICEGTSVKEIKGNKVITAGGV
jgi:glycine/D-amino acid oxidase-like deaminating enzyme